MAEDWPTFGRNPYRNMVAPDAKGLPDDFSPGKLKPGTDEVDPATMRQVKWVAKLGSQAYGNPAIVNGRIFLGTNNESPRDAKHKGDRGVVMCLDEKTGSLIWQLVVPKLGSGKVSDWEFLGICSSPTVEGDRVYIATNRCEIICLDANGLANGNDGLKDEGQYLAGPGNPPLAIGDKDGDVLWRFDMREDLGVFPHNTTAGSPLIIGDKLFVSTANGVDWGHTNIPNPRAPSVACLDKNKGTLLAEEASGLSQRVLHGNWTSATLGEATVDGKKKPIVLFPGPDGRLYGFDTEPVKDADGFNIMKELFRVDCNPPEYRVDEKGELRKYATPNGPSEIISSPMYHDGFVYVTIGQDPEHGDGVGAFLCIDINKAITAGAKAQDKDATKDAVVWTHKSLGRSLSTPTLVDGLLYAAEFTGVVHCIDAKTGAPYWTHDTKGRMWASTVVADGKVFIGNEDGILTILAAGKEKQLIREIEFPAPIYSSTVIVNGTMFIATQTHLYAVGAK